MYARLRAVGSGRLLWAAAWDGVSGEARDAEGGGGAREVAYEPLGEGGGWLAAPAGGTQLDLAEGAAAEAGAGAAWLVELSAAAGLSAAVDAAPRRPQRLLLCEPRGGARAGKRPGPDGAECDDVRWQAGAVVAARRRAGGGWVLELGGAGGAGGSGPSGDAGRRAALDASSGAACLIYSHPRTAPIAS